MRRRRRSRWTLLTPGRPRLRRRWLVLVVLAFVAFLYYRPVQGYLETRDTLSRRSAEVRALEREQRELRRRLAVQTSDAALLREARRLGYVKPGEKLYIVKGVAEWRRVHARRTRSSER